MPNTELDQLGSCLPTVDVIAKALYNLEFKSGRARCPFPSNHKNGDRDPSLRFDRAKNRLFCASQNCFGEKGADAFGLVRKMDGLTFPQAVSKLRTTYITCETAAQQQSNRVNGKSTRMESADRVRAALAAKGYKVADTFHYGSDFR